MKRLRLISLASVVLLAACDEKSESAVSDAAQANTEDCAAMAGLDLEDVRITAAEEIPGDGTWAFPHSVFNMFMGPDAVSSHDFCRVAGVIEDEIGFEVWLPPEWNGRLLNSGNGGLTGAIPYPSLHMSVGKGFAAAGTDTGHKTPDDFFDTDWIDDDHPERIENFGRRAHHLLAVNSKKIVEAYYGEPARHAYYEGCSSGGWQGLTEAQQYPTDYDGIVAGAPANNFVRLQTRAFYTASLLRDSGGAELNEADIALIIRAAYDHCDPADGVKDGIISDPEGCDFDPAMLACSETGNNQCLTPEKVERARTVFGPLKSPGGLQLYPGNAYGAAPFLGGGEGDIQPMILVMLSDEERGWTPETFDPDRDIPPLDEELGEVLNAWKTDLSVFREAGGKLIMYHGWTDPMLSPYNTLQYRAELADTMGEEALTDFLRLFMAPGMDHCRGGPGPSQFDAVGALVDWVEDGDAPSTLVAHGMTQDGEPRTRLLCDYPDIAIYDGEGDPDSADSYSCAAP